MRFAPMLALLVLSLLAGCSQASLYDFDGDGIPDSEDCAPEDPNIYPTAPDTEGNGVDENCDGIDGELVCDADGDNYVNELCGGNDCDDNDPDVNAAQEEICDGKDTDCDGDLPLGEVDLDMDGAAVCEGDCDDSSVVFNILDEDGDGYSTCDLLADCDDHVELLTPADLDFDGYSTCTGDCDDLAGLVHPLADELCDGLDTDCDGVVPPEETDGDGDGHAACADCDDADDSAWGWDEDGDGFDPCAGDCDESSSSVFPGAFDGWGDGADLNCDGVDGEDLDGDGWPGNASAGSASLDCDDTSALLNRNDVDGDAWDTCEGDCDDADPSRWPNNWGDAPADGVDGNCDGYDWFSLGSAGTAQLWGEAEGDFAGRALADLGDLGGDGSPEIVVGAPGAAGDRGRVYLVNSSDISAGQLVGLGTAPGILEGQSINFEGTGTAVANGGDIDGDGVPEVLAQLPQWPDGIVAVVSGSLLYPTGVVTTASSSALVEDAGSGSGTPMATVGDVDGDGLSDIVVGHRESGLAAVSAGAAALHLGSSLAGGTLTPDDAACLLLGEAASDHAGQNIVGLGDVDGDGLNDLAISAHDADPGGRVYILFGPTLSTCSTLSLADADVIVEGDGQCCFGEAVAAAGDVDGDGLADVVVGNAYSTASGANGRAYVFAGASLASGGTLGLADAVVEIVGAADDPYFGTEVAGGGDVDGDGLADVIVGSSSTRAGANSGAALLFLGATIQAGGTLASGDADAVFVAEDPGDRAGHTLTMPGDLDGDGRDDILIGAHYADGAAFNSGKVYAVFSPFP